jgi:hypothetical protein
MPSRSIGGAIAWERTARDPGARWGRDVEAFTQLAYPVRHAPKFCVGTTDRFFCIGSCFARNIEEHLIYRGVEVLSRRIYSPPSEWSGRPNGFINKFTAHSMLNEVEWVVEPRKGEAALFTESAAGWIDLQLCPGAPPVALARAIERRDYLSREYFARLQEADVVILTLGLNEAWFDASAGLYLNAAPPFSAVRREPERYRLDITTVAENVDALEALRLRLKALRPHIKLVLTVSPVPLDVSFSGEDPAVANSRSKAVLRSAADQLAQAHDDVDYFPSYEMVTLAPRAMAYSTDCQHVLDRTVAKVIGAFLEAHQMAGTPLYPDFNELAYMAANPDVEAAVRRSTFASGFQHWIEFGQREGRHLNPDTATQQMIRVGIASTVAE